MRLSVHHRTTYHYSSPVSNSVNELRLKPKESPWQHCEQSLVYTLPATRLSHFIDFNRNYVHHLEIPGAHDSLTIDSSCTVETRSKVDFEDLPYGFQHRDLAQLQRSEECHPFLQTSLYVTWDPATWRMAVDIKDSSEDVFQTSYAIMEHIYQHYSYQTGVTSVDTDAQQVIRRKEGVCQDFAHAMLALCRSLGIPARYVSGYFFDATHDSSLRGAQASHAWVEVFIADHGWIGLDPTNNKITDATYIVLATGRDYKDVSPISGTYYGHSQSFLDVFVKIERLPDRAVSRLV
ncbi:transglutaminase family protein [Verrucomicrobiaceae bacterium R5-34]|uniref:Transglutaminase family protein n=1 Tax=Oceaniferula flava TaxID=2800421 RepID=A0AAE2SBS9_9BACT|nr:transglutaminase family protein [Oceaniferula flavus]MBK1831630.1 transglutaminase family protein [Verrucomicrobiaceae bacterium R5-34]MBK1854034.1 transglutaminase family protein [Oceaniferula flavus]MBM1135340.1 transglutaminase family protein [Oceaniferula flavus]